MKTAITLTTTQIATLKDEILNFLLDGNTRTATYNAINEIRKEGTLGFAFTTTQINTYIKEVHEDLLENDLEPGHYTLELDPGFPQTETITIGNGLFSYEAPIETQEVPTQEEAFLADLAQDGITDTSDEALLAEYKKLLAEAIANEATREGLRNSPIQLRRRAIRHLNRELPEFIAYLKSRDLI